MTLQRLGIVFRRDNGVEDGLSRHGGQDLGDFCQVPGINVDENRVGVGDRVRWREGSMLSPRLGRRDLSSVTDRRALAPADCMTWFSLMLIKRRYLERDLGNAR